MHQHCGLKGGRVRKGMAIKADQFRENGCGLTRMGMWSKSTLPLDKSTLSQYPVGESLEETEEY